MACERVSGESISGFSMKSWHHLFAVGVSTAFILSCGDGGTGVQDPVVSSVRVTPAVDTIEVGESVQLQAVALDDEGSAVGGVTVSWRSQPSAVASVSSTGAVTGLSAGEATVTATVAGVSDEAVVTVEEPVPSAPTALTAEATARTEVELGWDDASTDETSFQVEREGPGGGFSLVGSVGADATSFTDVGLQKATEYRYRVRACNDEGCSGFAGPVSVTTLDDLGVSTSSVPAATVGVVYETELEAEGGRAPFEWSISAGALPDGVGLATDGTVSGTPTAAGSFDFTAEVRSDDGQSATVDLTLAVAEPLQVASTTLPEAEAGMPYDEDLAAEGGSAPYGWALVQGETPQGLTFDPAGAVSGTPTLVGSFDFTVRVTDAEGRTAEAVVSLTVGGTPLPPTITTSSVPEGKTGTFYAASFEATGGDGSLVWSLAQGQLPSGLELRGVGTIVGVPTEPDTSEVTVQVESAGMTATADFTLRIQADTVLRVVTGVLPPGTVGQPYDATVRVSGGEPPYAWSLVSGFVPSGLALSSDGTVSGVPTQVASRTFTVEVESGDGQVATAPLEIEVESQVDTSPAGFDLTVLAVAGIPESVGPNVGAAVARWERAIVGDLPPVSIPDDAFSPGSCGGFGQDVNGLEVEDIVVLVNIASIDGPGGVLGQAGPCGIRGGSGLPYVGVLTLDLDDLEPRAGTDNLTDIIFHEIGHILGIGTLWDTFSLLQGEGSSDPLYTGAEGFEQYQLLGGVRGGVPVANTGGGGTRDAHWREDTFQTEIMTGFAEPLGTPMPLSTITIGSMADFGYEVDLTEADDYTIPTATPPAVGSGSGSGGTDLVLREPLVVVERDGRVYVLPAR